MQNRISLDDVAAGGALARLKLVGELARIKAGLKDAGDGPLAAVKRLKLVARANQIRVALGAAAPQPKATPPAASPNPVPVAIAPAMPPQGQAVAAVGSPNGWGFSLSAGLVSRYGSAAGMFATRPMLQIAAPIIGGNSGGLVFNARGEAVGMVSFGKQAFNQAVPIGRVMELAAEIERRAAIIDPCKARANGEACG